MAEFKVTRIIDGDTFEVTPNWTWNNQEGNRVRPTGYDTPEFGETGRTRAKEKLQRLILGKMVTLGNVHTIDRGRLVCEVYLNRKRLADYFSEYH